MVMLYSGLPGRYVVPRREHFRIRAGCHGCLRGKEPHRYLLLWPKRPRTHALKRSSRRYRNGVLRRLSIAYQNMEGHLFDLATASARAAGAPRNIFSFFFYVYLLGHEYDTF